MTNHRPYEVYKETGIHWLDRVPSNWKITKAGRITRLTTGWTPPTGDASSYLGDNLWANISDLGPRQLFHTAKSISDDAVGRARIKPSPKGSLLFSFKLSVGQVSFAGTDMYTNEAIATFQETPELALSYAYYALPLFLLQNANTNIYGASLLNQELMTSAPICLPNKQDQQTIARYLDRETAQIDELIANQERLIELLTEKRQAIIDRAVAGRASATTLAKLRFWTILNPPVPAVLRKQPDIERSFLPMSTIGEKGDVDLSSKRPVGDVLTGYSYFRDDDVAFAKVTPCFENKKGAILRGLHGGEGFGTTEITVLRCSSGLLPDYLYLLTQSTAFLSNGKAAMTGAGGLKRVPDEFVRNFEFERPDTATQLAAVKDTKAKTARIDTLVEKAQMAIKLMRERRSALISAAVTGRIDVREGVA